MRDHSRAPSAWGPPAFGSCLHDATALSLFEISPNLISSAPVAGSGQDCLSAEAETRRPSSWTEPRPIHTVTIETGRHLEETASRLCLPPFFGSLSAHWETSPKPNMDLPCRMFWGACIERTEAHQYRFRASADPLHSFCLRSTHQIHYNNNSVHMTLTTRSQRRLRSPMLASQGGLFLPRPL